MAPPKLTARKVSEMRRLYSDADSALSLSDLGRLFDVTEATVRYHIRDLRQSKRQFVNVESLMALKAQGLKQTLIASRLKIHPRTVRKVLCRVEGRTA